MLLFLCPRDSAAHDSSIPSTDFYVAVVVADKHINAFFFSFFVVCSSEEIVHCYEQFSALTTNVIFFFFFFFYQRTSFHVCRKASSIFTFESVVLSKWISKQRDLISA